MEMQAIILAGGSKIAEGGIYPYLLIVQEYKKWDDSACQSAA